VCYKGFGLGENKKGAEKTFSKGEIILEAKKVQLSQGL
jgi:hypothetical protein